MQVKISEFPTSELSSDTLVPIVQNGINYSAEVRQFDLLGSYIGYKNVSGLTYTLTLSDVGYLVRKDHNIDHEVRIPKDIFPPQTLLIIRNSGTDSMYVVPDVLSGITINYSLSLSSNIIEPHFTTQLYHIENNEWDIL